MNRRGKRLTLGVMAVGLAVVLVLAILHWSAIRDHVEAWTFQLTRETETFEPDQCQPDGIEVVVWPGGSQVVDLKLWVQALAQQSGLPVIFDEPAWKGLGRIVGYPDSGTVSIAALRLMGYRVLEQRFPRRAYVIVADPWLQGMRAMTELGSSPMHPSDREVSAPGGAEPTRQPLRRR